jgi:ribosomal protein S12 methylthiotransferase
MTEILVYLETLGCSKNLVDSEALLGFLLKRSFRVLDSPEGAHLLLLNTCSFIESAREQAIERILDLARIKEEQGGVLAVFGCLPQRYAEELAVEMPEIDYLSGVGRQEEIAAALEVLLRERGDVTGTPVGEGGMFAGFVDRPLLTPPHLAYVKIAEGCSRRCSFCAIPSIRGNFRSRPIDAIVGETETLVAGGVREINIISQDTAAYGRDSGADLISLVRGLSTIEDLRWVRLFYLHPAMITAEEILELYEVEKVVPYLDMPIQHASDSMLRRMRRGHTRAELETLLTRLRKARPDLVLRTSVLLGHPGETESDFQELLELLDRHPFHKLGVFTFSEEEGTAAAGNPDAVEMEIVQERLERLQLTQIAISEELNSELVGKRFDGFVEALESVGEGLPASRSLDPLSSSPFEGMKAAVRISRDAYEVDGHLFLAEEDSLSLGDFVSVEITEADVYDLKGRLTPDAGLS